MSEREIIEFIKSFGLSETVAHQLSAGFDIMTDAGYSRERIESTLGGALRIGANPEQMARKMVLFSRIVKDSTDRRQR